MPSAIASATGRPNPSASDGNSSARAPRDQRRAARRAAGTADGSRPRAVGRSPHRPGRRCTSGGRAAGAPGCDEPRQVLARLDHAAEQEIAVRAPARHGSVAASAARTSTASPAIRDALGRARPATRTISPRLCSETVTIPSACVRSPRSGRAAASGSLSGQLRVGERDDVVNGVEIAPSPRSAPASDRSSA